jgi:hypothetical protein
MNKSKVRLQVVGHLPILERILPVVALSITSEKNNIPK